MHQHEARAKFVEGRRQLVSVFRDQGVATHGEVQVAHARLLCQFTFVCREGLALLAQIDHKGIAPVGHDLEFRHVHLATAHHAGGEASEVLDFQCGGFGCDSSRPGTGNDGQHGEGAQALPPSGD